MRPGIMLVDTISADSYNESHDPADGQSSARPDAYLQVPVSTRVEMAEALWRMNARRLSPKE